MRIVEVSLGDRQLLAEHTYREQFIHVNVTDPGVGGQGGHLTAAIETLGKEKNERN